MKKNWILIRTYLINILKINKNLFQNHNCFIFTISIILQCVKLNIKINMDILSDFFENTMTLKDLKDHEEIKDKFRKILLKKVLERNQQLPTCIN